MFRVLSAFKLNPYEVLGITLTSATDPDAINGMIKKAYRTKSLLLHPDKLKHARGPESFDMLKKVSPVVLCFVAELKTYRMHRRKRN